MRDLIGQTLGHYRVVEKIGEGGMGEVYRAHDERLDRDVAIKILPESVADNPERLARFEREAKAVAKLSHANILEIFDFGRDDDVTYAVTELLDGRTLRESLAGRPMPWRKAAEIGACVADGLSAAHDKNIVHRDIKPSNVFLCSDGRVKILDFGLASDAAVDFDADTRSIEKPITREGRILGTIGYMSPEQARGHHADHRSDIFSLGCVLYEMVSGTRPFDRASSADTLVAILNEAPPPLSEAKIETAPEVTSIIERCLEKEPSSRFQSASDLAYNLRAISTASTPSLNGYGVQLGARRKRIALIGLAVVIVAAVAMTFALRGPLSEEPSAEQPEVVPNRVAVAQFENRTGDPSLDTVGSLTTDLIARRFTEVGVADVVPIPLTLGYTPPDFPEGERTREWDETLDRARRRNATLLLSGAYYLDGEFVRLQARLVDPATGSLIYAFDPVLSSRDTTADGIEALADRALAAVTIHLDWGYDLRVSTPPSTYEACRAFLRGFELLATDPHGSIEQFRRTYEIDPEFFVAKLQVIGIQYSHLGDFEGARREFEVFEGQYQDRMTPYELAMNRYLRSWLDWDRPAMLNHMRRAYKLSQYAAHRMSVGSLTLSLNRPRQAIETLEPMVLSSSPGEAPVQEYLLPYVTIAQHLIGDYERELEYANLGLEHFPDAANFFADKARALAALEETSSVNQIIDDFLRSQKRGGSAGWLMSRTAMELRAHGHREQADEMAARSVEWYGSHPSALPNESWEFGYALWMLGRWRRLEELIVPLIDSGRFYPASAGDAGVIVEARFYPAFTGWLGVIAAINGNDDTAKHYADDLPVGNTPQYLAFSFYWRAAIAAHLGDKEGAVELLSDAFLNGYPYTIELHRNPELEPLWDYPPFQELIRPKG